MRILRKIGLYFLQFYLGSIAVIGVVFGLSWNAFKFGFEGYSDDVLDKLSEWKEE